MSRRFQTKTERIDELEKALREARIALKFLHDETADYIMVNKLGKVHHNSAMQQAALVLGIQFEL